MLRELVNTPIRITEIQPGTISPPCSPCPSCAALNRILTPRPSLSQPSLPHQAWSKPNSPSLGSGAIVPPLRPSTRARNRSLRRTSRRRSCGPRRGLIMLILLRCWCFRFVRLVLGRFIGVRSSRLCRDGSQDVARRGGRVANMKLLITLPEALADRSLDSHLQRV